MSAGNALQAVRLLHEHKPDGWIEKLSLIVRQVAAEDVLRQCARAFLANGDDRCGNRRVALHAIDATPDASLNCGEVVLRDAPYQWTSASGRRRGQREASRESLSLLDGVGLPPVDSASRPRRRREMT